jgi:hypothetical protein
LHSFRVLSDVEVNWEFWPYWAEPNCKPCEPDVALRFEHGPQKWLICVEAKYRSGKSSLEEVEEQSPTDQLAREWVNLVSFARREGRQPFLVYLTTDLTIPEKDLADSLRNLKRHGAKTDPAILWLSWASLEPVLADALPAVASEVIIKTDLAALLHRLGLQAPRFTGITVPTIIATALWSFARE